MGENSIEVKGKTVDEAIFEGLAQLGLGIDQVDIEIVQEGNKGFLGIGRSAVVKFTVKGNPDSAAEAFLTGLLEKMNIHATLKTEEKEDGLFIAIEGDSSGVLIGRRGETLDALQYLTSLVVNKKQEVYKRVVLDTENYRKKREETLVKLAKRMAEKAYKSGKRVVMEPMNPYERRILHATLQGNNKVETISEGEEPYRKVIIKKKK